MTSGMSVCRAFLRYFVDISLIRCTGGLLAAGITYGTKNMDSTWAWRLPSALQCIFSILCIIILPFIPESPRWLVHRGRLDEALEIVALTHADGDATSPIVLVQYQEIVDTLTFEREAGETLSMSQIVKTPSSRKRVLLALSVAIFTACSGMVFSFPFLYDLC
jgi:hypothetical protein